MTTVTIPITGTVDRAFQAQLDALAASFEHLGETSDNTARLAGRSWLLTSTAVERAKDVATEALNALREKGAEFVRAQGDTIAQGLGGIAEVGLKALGAAGPWGAGAAATVGAVGLLVTTMNSYQAELDRVTAASDAVATANVALGSSYASVAEAVRGTTSAEAARIAVAQQIQAVTSAQIAIVQQGRTVSEAREQVRAVQELSNASRIGATATNQFTEAMIQHAVTAGNMAEQQLVLGTAVERSTNADIEQQNELRRTTAAMALRTRQAMENAEANYRVVRANIDGNRSMVEQIRAEGSALRVLTEARERNTTAQIVATQTDNAAALAIIRLNEQLAAGAQLTAEGASRKAKTAEQRAAAIAHAGDALALRTAIEALRVAVAENATAGETLDLSERQRLAALALAAATREVALADAALHRGGQTLAERQALTTALNAQTAAQRAAQATTAEETTAIRDKTAALREQFLVMRMAPRWGLSERAANDQGAAGVGRLNEPADITAANDNEQARGVMVAQAEMADMLREKERERLSDSLEQHQSYTGRLRELYAHQQDYAGAAADFTSKAFSAMGSAIGDHILAVVSGRETLATALQGMLADTLSAIAKEAAIKGGLYFAEGLGRLALWDGVGALQSFGASAAFFGVAGLAGAASAAVAPAPATAAPSTAGGQSGANGAGSLSPGRNDSRGEGVVINVNFGGAVYGASGARGAAREIVNLLNEQATQSGVQFSPRLMGGVRP